jgi:hypothetical protein
VTDQPRTETIEVPPGTKLHMSGLTATTRVKRGTDSTIKVTITGPKEWRDTVEVNHSRGKVEVTEPNNGGSNVTIRGGGVVISGDSRGAIVTGSGNVMTSMFGRVSGATVVSGSGRVVVNGVDVTDVVNERSGRTRYDDTPRRIDIEVPAQTDIGAHSCQAVHTDGIGGKVRGHLSGQGVLSAQAVSGLKLHISGQSRATVTDADGDADVDLAGQSTVAISGAFAEVYLDVSGQSSVTVSGSASRVSGSASGMSTVTVTGPVESERIDTSGMSTATVNGRAVGGRKARWDW